VSVMGGRIGFLMVDRGLGLLCRVILPDWREVAEKRRAAQEDHI